MISVNSVYTAVQRILNKENRGYLKPEDFNNLAEVAFYDVYNTIKEDYSSARSAAIKGKGSKDSLEYLEESMNTFYKPATLTLVGTQFPKPADFDMLDTMYYGDIEISKASVRDVKLMRTISYMTPDDSTPVFIEYLDEYEVISGSNIDEVEIFYYRIPKSPRWTYVVVGNDILYDGSSPQKQDIELPQGFYSEMVSKILFYAGVVIRDDKMLQSLLAESQADSIADYRDKTITR